MDRAVPPGRVGGPAICSAIAPTSPRASLTQNESRSYALFMDPRDSLERRTSGLEPGSINVAGVRRTYWLARAPQRPGQRASVPLLIALHG